MEMSRPLAAEEVMHLFNGAIGKRTNFDNHWQQVGERVWPETANFTRTTQQGEKRHQEMYDSTAAQALRRFAAFLESALTPRAQKWHRLRASNEDLNKHPEVKSYFDEVGRIMFAVRNAARANYYSQMHEGYMSLGAYGNKCMYSEGIPGVGIQYRHCEVSHTWIELDSWRRVDSVFYKYPMTARAAAAHWPERITPKIKAQLETNPFTEMEFLHYVRPRPRWLPGYPGADGMPFESYHLSLLDKEILEYRGYHELPYMFSRYLVSRGESYGRSPAMQVLADIKTLNSMERTHLRSGHLAAEPPLLTTSDGVIGLGAQKVRLDPGKLTPGGLDPMGNLLVKPLISGARPELNEMMMERKQKNINDAFLVTLFQIFVEGPSNQTATEVLERAQEKGIMLAPEIGRQQSEQLGPQITRDANLLERMGLLPPPPPVLIEAAGEYEIVYESHATRLQRMEEAVSITRTLEVTAPLINANPSLLENFEGDEIVRGVAEVFGVPGKWMRTPEQVSRMREAQAEEAEEQAQAEMAPQLAAALKDSATAAQTMRTVH